ncbi:acetolactate synthase, small subunit [Syntrophobotulus glycolicus DSM 8271]|uniref:Acetolactate synthase small subunit n=1 Tax=Syntrophobotulus glycolicus (strain DSM 8271 / FlGlyR) TaxID=645991 RepID=F0T258_SYNGF|nr:acetolactate synthase small subunit [Syntrophobotulus glycolicus]ADY56402.1 acetolactate synthase, small subunit [Syntrophobotulus glycolicus DSM 8271]
MKHTLAVLVENKPGVLTHISGLISRRAFNIESIAAGYTEEPDMTRITIEVEADNEYELEQVVNQLSKLIDVIKIIDLSGKERIHRELALIKVSASPESRADIINIADIFRAHIVDVNKDTMIIELTGETMKIDALCELLKEYGIKEIVRTGKVAICRGALAAKEI